MNDIELTIGYFVVYINYVSLLQIYANFLLYTAQDKKFGVAAYDADKRNSVQPYINYGYRFTTINFGNELVYLPL